MSLYCQSVWFVCHLLFICSLLPISTQTHTNNSFEAGVRSAVIRVIRLIQKSQHSTTTFAFAAETNRSQNRSITTAAAESKPPGVVVDDDINDKLKIAQCGKQIDLGGVCTSIVVVRGTTAPEVRREEERRESAWPQQEWTERLLAGQRRVCVDRWSPWQKCEWLVSLATRPSSRSHRQFRQAVETLGCGRALSTVAVDPDRLCSAAKHHNSFDAGDGVGGGGGGADDSVGGGWEDNSSGGGGADYSQKEARFVPSDQRSSSDDFLLSAVLRDLHLDREPERAVQLLDVDVSGCELHLLSQLLRNEAETDVVTNRATLHTTNTQGNHTENNTTNPQQMKLNSKVVKPSQLTLRFTFERSTERSDEDYSENNSDDDEEQVVFAESHLIETVQLFDRLQKSHYQLTSARANSQCVAVIQEKFGLCLPTELGTSWSFIEQTDADTT